MKNIIRTMGLLFLLVFSAGISYSQVVEPPLVVDETSDDWTLLLEKDGVKIEYKYQVCNNETVSNQVLVLFKFTNTTSDIKTMTWSTKEFRNGSCTNCDRIDNSEYSRSITLSPGEVLEGDGTSKVDKNVYLFSHFVKLIPGMSDQKLTDFEFVDVNVTTYSN